VPNHRNIQSQQIPSNSDDQRRHFRTGEM